MVMCDEQVGHSKEGRVHDACRPGEEDNADGVLRQCHQHHAATVEEQSADVDLPRSERQKIKRIIPSNSRS